MRVLQSFWAALVVLNAAASLAEGRLLATEEARLVGWNGETFHPARTFASEDVQGSSRRLSRTSLPQVEVEVLSWTPRVFMLNNFLSDSEVDHIKGLAAPRLSQSLVADDETGKFLLSEVRTSTSTFLNRAETDVVGAVEKRLAQYTHFPVENGEPLEVLHYAKGQVNMNHYDFFHDPESVQHGGQRAATVLLYLSDVEEGGETVFFQPVAEEELWDPANCTARAQLVVKPRKGAALLFHNLRPDGSVDEASLHGSCPVRKGVKWSATKWIRERRFDMPEDGKQPTNASASEVMQLAMSLEVKRGLLDEQIKLITQQIDKLAPALAELQQHEGASQGGSTAATTAQQEAQTEAAGAT